MKSAKQKRQEITAKREKYAKKKADNAVKAKIATPLTRRPINSILANVEALAHNNTYGPLPLLMLIDSLSVEIVVSKKSGQQRSRNGGTKSRKVILIHLP